MVSCDTYIASSSGYFLLSQPEICSGDQSALSFSATESRRRSFTESRHLLGRRALCQAFSSALVARYLLRPPLRFTSLQTVEADRSSRVAITRRDCPVASPREISSRSAGMSAHLRLCRSGGEKPPVASIIPWMEPGAFCRARAMSLIDSPFCLTLRLLQLHAISPARTIADLCTLRSTKFCAQDILHGLSHLRPEPQCDSSGILLGAFQDQLVVHREQKVGAWVRIR